MKFSALVLSLIFGFAVAQANACEKMDAETHAKMSAAHNDAAECLKKGGTKEDCNAKVRDIAKAHCKDCKDCKDSQCEHKKANDCESGDCPMNKKKKK